MSGKNWSLSIYVTDTLGGKIFYCEDKQIEFLIASGLRTRCHELVNTSRLCAEYQTSTFHLCHHIYICFKNDRHEWWNFFIFKSPTSLQSILLLIANAASNKQNVSILHFFVHPQSLYFSWFWYKHIIYQFILFYSIIVCMNCRICYTQVYVRTHLLGPCVSCYMYMNITFHWNNHKLYWGRL